MSESRKTKRMVEINGKKTELLLSEKATQNTLGKLQALSPASNAGIAAKTAAIEKVGLRLNEILSEISKLDELHEVAVVEMTSGEDQEFAEPTPADTLRQAS